jgi:hypothetical protein
MAYALRDQVGQLTIESALVLSKADKKRRHRCRCTCGCVVYLLPSELAQRTTCGKCEAA